LKKDQQLQATVPLAGSIDESTVNGDGIRYVIFVQGCHHGCKGCHNPQMWSMNGGKQTTLASILHEVVSNPLLSGITFSGGEPFLYAKELALLAKEIKAIGKNIWCYSGYTHSELKSLVAENTDIADLLANIDTLVDGKFIESLKDEKLPFRGSSNQNIIHLKN